MIQIKMDVVEYSYVFLVTMCQNCESCYFQTVFLQGNVEFMGAGRGGGGGGGAPRNGTSTCRSLINISHTNHADLTTICDIMNTIESSKIIEVHQLLHITLTIPVTSATAEQRFSAMRRLKSLQ